MAMLDAVTLPSPLALKTLVIEIDTPAVVLVTLPDNTSASPLLEKLSCTVIVAPEATSARDAFSTRAPAEIEPSNDSCFTNTSSAPLVVSFDCRLQLLPNANTWALIGEAVVQVRDVDVSNEKDERTAKLASAVHSTLVRYTCTAETDDVVCQLDDDELSKLTLTA